MRRAAGAPEVAGYCGGQLARLGWQGTAAGNLARLGWQGRSPCDNQIPQRATHVTTTPSYESFEGPPRDRTIDC